MPWSDMDDARLQAALDRGWRLEDVAAFLGRSPIEIMKRVVELGLKFRRPF